MLVFTDKMKQDIAKQREQDIIVCDACGSDKVVEKMWVETNSYMYIDGETYYKYDDSIDEGQYWCNKCNEESLPIHISEYEGDKDD